MSKVTFLPINRVCEVDEGESILDAAIRCCIPIEHACGGFCACTTCHILVKNEDLCFLSPIEEDEAERLASFSEFDPTKKSRLACQAKVIQNIVVEIVNLELDH